MDWSQWKGYANPPWNLVGRVLAQTRHQKARLVIVTPVWSSQVWYPTLLDMLTDIPRLIPWRENLIQPSHPEAMPDVIPQLAVWTISGEDIESVNFRKKLQSFSSHHGERSHPRAMTHSSESGSAGVTKGIQIPFQDLQGKLTSWQIYSRRVISTDP